ncbi:Crp/Fnr family transcriptional regulator [Paracoccus benzoatiresistens]|uniref:Crp/Fnr family transcriptional regulator n=1 Tax=Paracoccus benzoatiresistens TaxID=2997341 RepID=A0ABT4J5F7_9RHOB|nr:Crp/Fnr family transcriptional regulator [Paracoccus sp. EF6]MCZ0962361.1 Crp/Fnr family transcriptional regulator [Paracoccus sp. EF6]
MNQFVQNQISRLGVLAQTGWLSRQPLDFQARISRLGHWREAKAGEILYLAGDDADWMVGLAEGAVEITFPLVGDEPVVIHRAEPGFWTGEASVLADQRRLISIAAATRARVFVLSAPGIRRMLEEEPRHWKPFFELSLTSSLTAVTLLAEALSLSPRARVARILLRLAQADGSVTCSKEDLGRLLGMTRSSARRALTSLTEMGAVQSGYGILSIRDRGKLERLTGEAWPGADACQLGS